MYKVDRQKLVNADGTHEQVTDHHHGPGREAIALDLNKECTSDHNFLPYTAPFFISIEKPASLIFIKMVSL
jgi:hypothetical protein